MSQMIFKLINRTISHFHRRESKLLQAIVNNDLVAVKQLLQQGANPNSYIPEQDQIPLLFSIFIKNYFTLPSGVQSDHPKTSYHLTAKQECLHLLLEYGANPDVTNDCGRTPLEIAILWCMPEIVKLLLIYQANPNRKNKKGMTPLMQTAILGIQDARPINDKLQIIMHLIDAGAEIDAQSTEGKTALMYATGNSRLEIVELLISSGASLSIEDGLGNRACDIIDRGVTPAQRAYLQTILTQPQLNILKYKYQEFIPEGDRWLNSIL